MINYFEFVLILIIIALGVWVWKLYLEKQEAEKEVVALENENQEMEGFGKGLDEYNKKMQEKKDEAKGQITKLITERGRASNLEICKDLGLSSRTTVRYLDELEAEGRARQVGKTGKNVFYSK